MTTPPPPPGWTAQDGSDHPNVQACLALVSSTYSANEAERLRSAAQEFYRRAAWRFLDDHTPEALLGVLGAVVHLLDHKPADDIAVRVFRPTAAADGWECPHTVIIAGVRDRPFVYDSIHEYLTEVVGPVGANIHPVLGIEHRKEEVWIAPPREAAERQAVVVFEVPAVPPEREAELAAGIEEVLSLVVPATDDYDAMREQVAALVADLQQRTAGAADPADLQEAIAFLQWLEDKHFVYLGYRAYDIVHHEGEDALMVRSGTGLGILRNEAASSVADPVPLRELAPDMQRFLRTGSVLTVAKSSNHGVVHRRTRMDYIGVKQVDAGGTVTGECRILGLFTAKALSSPAAEIPILRRKLEVLLDRTGLPPGAHDYKELIDLFEGLPKDDLFHASIDELQQTIDTIALAEREVGVRCAIREGFRARGVFVTVIMPRDRFNAAVRERIHALLVRRFEATASDYKLVLGGVATARLHFHLTRDTGDIPAVDRVELERELARLVESWQDRLLAHLRTVHPPSTAEAISVAWGAAFPDGYEEHVHAAEAADDIVYMQWAMETDTPQVRLVDVRPGEQVTRLKLYSPHGRVVLSDVMPVLEALGLRVVDEIPSDVRTPDGRLCAIHDFGVLDHSTQTPLDVSALEDRLPEAVVRVLAGDAQSDRLNALVVRAGMHWREVVLLRMYLRYFRQLGTPLTAMYLYNVLGRYGELCRLLVAYFTAKFAPAEGGSASQRLADALPGLRAEIEAHIGNIKSLEDDRILRAVLNLMDSTLRTNYFRDGGTLPYIAIKIRSGDVLQMPLPRPVFEIFVHSPTMEGIHLRGGRVARGGIRWSDRPEDYRTEILGLMKTQMTKNAVIVPVGSKGGFIIRTPATDRAALAEQVTAEYTTFMRGLLDLTDNVRGDAITRPADVVAYDEDDPYLVVAADKGTAHLSDTANAVSEAYEFWLGDAFASGGSAGYDHKKMGITARGAWECAKRHFLEREKDIQTEPFTVVGIGDMSGDVFGNGMLLSKATCLVAAFNHLHIFLDPNPDPEQSWAERKRLFELPRSAWTDYDPALISEGGGVHDRMAKRIALSPQVRAVLDIEAEDLPGPELIQAILCAPVEMLYNGGIGTYIKHSEESDLEVGDKANDSVRVDGWDVRAKVVVEGGNLGITQRGRIQLAQRGVRINTDAIDNSGGVDTSDHEVNLKILLKQAITDGTLSADTRNGLLMELTDTVAHLVLRTNFLQAVLLTRDEQRAQLRPWEYRTLLQTLCEEAQLDRATEYLPEDVDLREREAAGEWLTRPELAVLVGYTKNWLTDVVWHSELTQDPHLEHHVHAYFPHRVVAAYEDTIGRHRLRRELLAMLLANRVVNQAGLTFVQRTCDHTSAEPAEVVWAYLVGDEIFRLGELRGEILSEESALSARNQYDALNSIEAVLEDVAHWILHNLTPLTPLSEILTRFRGSMEATEEALFALHEELQSADITGAEAAYTERGFPETLAAQLALLPVLRSVLDVLLISDHTEMAPEDVSSVYLQSDSLLRLPWLQDQILALSGADAMERTALQTVREDLQRHHRHIVYATLRSRREHEAPTDALKRFWDARGRQINRFLSTIAQVRDPAELDLATLTVIARDLKRI